MSKEAPAPAIVESLKTWWRWLRGCARSKAVLWTSVIALAIASVWWNWPEIEQKPFVKSILEFLMPQPALPVAQRDKYGVLLADIAGDKEEQMVTNIADSLNGLEGVHAARLKRPLPGDKSSQTLSKVQQYLDETGFDVLIWGRAIRHDGRSVPKLFLEHAAAGRVEQRSVRQGRYALVDQTFELPELFWSDLRAVLQLKIASDSSVASEYGTYTAERLQPVIEKIERLIDSSDFSRWSEGTRAAIWGSLGGSYAALGDQTGQEVWLQRAIAAFREALKVWTHERVPLGWAGTQNNLGNVLQMLGERRWDEKTLEEALAAYREALKERTRERVPLGWAGTQNNLGTALSTLGERRRDEKTLEEALEAYREALKEFTRERVPLYWAVTQNNLGNALSTLGELRRDEKTLEEALTAYREALKEHTRERVPLGWATTQSNLGDALSTVGEQSGDEKTLEAALATYREALKERTRERVPLHWAGTQNNLGAALLILGERRGDEKTLEEAVAVFREALKEYTRERVPLDWAGTQTNLGYALTTLARQRGDKGVLLEVISVSRKVLAELKGKGAMVHTEAARNTLRRAERSLAALRTSRARH